MSSNVSFASATDCRLAIQDSVQNPWIIGDGIRYRIPTLEDVIVLPLMVTTNHNDNNHSSNHKQQYILLNPLLQTDPLVRASTWYCGNLEHAAHWAHLETLIQTHQYFNSSSNNNNSLKKDSSLENAGPVPTRNLFVQRPRQHDQVIVPCPLVVPPTPMNTTSSNHHHSNDSGSHAPIAVTHLWSSVAERQTGVWPVYDLRLFQTCNRLETLEFWNQTNQQRHPERRRQEHAEDATTRTNHTRLRPYESPFSPEPNHHKNTTIMSPSSPPPQVGACLITWGDKSRQALHEWIVYHRLLGVSHFWIHINEDWNTTYNNPTMNLSYVTYIPYNYHYRDYVPDAGGAVFPWQQTMQMRCLWNAKKFGFDWVITTDSDEFLDISDPDIIHRNSTAVIDPLSVSLADATAVTEDAPLLQFLRRFNAEKIGSLILASVPYGDHKTNKTNFLTVVPHDNTTSDSPPIKTSIVLKMDQVWRNRDLKHTKYKRQKMVYSVPTAASIGIHYLLKCSAAHDPDRQVGCQMTHVEQTSLFIRHYREARTRTGILYNNNITALAPDPRLPEQYRHTVLAVMTQHQIKHNNNSQSGIR